jgi:predicted nucleic acid-binding protein
VNFLDANVIIRLIEGSSGARQSIQARLAGQKTVLCSQFSRLECRCQPIRSKNQAVLDAYDMFFSSTEVAVVPIDVKVIDLATEIRATHASFKSPDAFQLACAIAAGASVFLTGDTRLKQFGGILVEII